MEDLASTALGTETEFWKQFAGSGSANVLTIIAIGLFLGLKKLCNRETRCKSHIHCCCLDLDVRDKTSHERPEITDEGEPSQV